MKNFVNEEIEVALLPRPGLDMGEGGGANMIIA